MKEKHYKIYVTSRIRFLLIMVPLTPCLILLFFKVLEKLNFYNGYLIVVPLILGFIISSNLSRGTVEISLSEKGVKLNWLKSFIFDKPDNLFILWKHIDNFDINSDNTFDDYCINLKNKIRLKISRLKILWIKDDLKQWRIDFPQYINKYKVSDS